MASGVLVKGLGQRSKVLLVLLQLFNNDLVNLASGSTVTFNLQLGTSGCAGDNVNSPTVNITGDLNTPVDTGSGEQSLSGSVIMQSCDSGTSTGQYKWDGQTTEYILTANGTCLLHADAAHPFTGSDNLTNATNAYKLTCITAGPESSSSSSTDEVSTSSSSSSTDDTETSNNTSSSSSSTETADNPSSSSSSTETADNPSSSSSSTETSNNPSSSSSSSDASTAMTTSLKITFTSETDPTDNQRKAMCNGCAEAIETTLDEIEKVEVAKKDGCVLVTSRARALATDKILSMKFEITPKTGRDSAAINSAISNKAATLEKNIKQEVRAKASDAGLNVTVKAVPEIEVMEGRTTAASSTSNSVGYIFWAVTAVLFASQC